MPIINTVYELDERLSVGGRLAVVKIRVDSQVLLFSPLGGRINVPDSDPPDLEVTIPSTASRDGGWGRPRGVMVAWTGSPPSGYKPGGKVFIPVLQPSRWAEYKVHQTGTFKGSGCIIVSKLPEQLGR